VISANFAYINGGACFIEGGNSVLSNSILWINSAAYSGDEIYSLSSIYITVEYSDISGGWQGNGNIDNDPLFRHSNEGDYRLMSVDCGYENNSPCIDVGSPLEIDSLIDCDWGLGANLCDIGAYGGGIKLQRYDYLLGDVNMFEGIWHPEVDINDVIYLVGYFRREVTSQPCYLGGFFASADINGDCKVIGSDVTCFVNYFRGLTDLNHCYNFVPAWRTMNDLPPGRPINWPNCE
jgi:hypothetical protein